MMSVERESLALRDQCIDLSRAAKAASRVLALTNGLVRNEALKRLADRLEASQAAILAANAVDVAAAEINELKSAFVDRLRLNKRRIEQMAEAVREIAAFPDPLGRVIEGGVRPNGLQVTKIRVPLGVVFFIYESRPNVTTDAAALCLKSGNAVILRGGSEAKNSNAALGKIIGEALADAGLPQAAASMVATTNRAAVDLFLQADEFIDLAIPRGGEELIRRVASTARMPVLKHHKGVCHVFLDRSAEPEMATRILENSKCQRPSVCNAAECLLVHAEAAAELLPRVARRMQERGVELRGCPRTRELVPSCKQAAESDYGCEFGELILAVKVVDGIEDALAHIQRFGSGHTETIVTGDLRAARTFTSAVDASAVLVNASTRFNDGGQFGLGAEIGVSTDKFHARGPCGLNELTSSKYIVFGDGHIRE